MEQGYIEAPLFKPESINALHYVADSSLVMIFEVINLIKRYWKRINDSATDFNQVRRIRGKIDESKRILFRETCSNFTFLLHLLSSDI